MKPLRTAAAVLSVVLAAGCASVPPTAKPIAVFLPVYTSAGTKGAADVGATVQTAAAQALTSSGRYALRTRGLFETGWDAVLAATGYAETAELDPAARVSVAATLRVAVFVATDVIGDAPHRLWRVHLRLLGADTGRVIEATSFTIPWGDSDAALRTAVRRVLREPHPPTEPETDPWLDRSGDWTLWWSLAPALPQDAARWRQGLLAARFAGDHAEALRLADLLLGRVWGTSGRPSFRERRLLSLEEPWVAGDPAWLRAFLLREAAVDREALDRRTLLATLNGAVGSATDEELLLPRFLDLVRGTEASSRAADGEDVAQAFRQRFGLELSAALARPSLGFVEGGSFAMGSDHGEDDERPVHRVKVGSFLMARTEVTQSQYAEVTGGNPSLFASGPEADQQPVERVTWFDAVEFCNQLSVADGLDPVYTITHRRPESGYPIEGADVVQDRSKTGYRLPTEAEWEWAARGGVAAQGALLAGAGDPRLVAWTDDESRGPSPVARKQPNELGLYDLSGNVWEWCSDWYGRYPSQAERDPEGPALGALKVGRGGSWHAAAWNARVTARSFDSPGSRGGNLGFRVVRTVTLPKAD